MSDLDIQIAGVASFWDYQMPGNAMEELAEAIQAINKVERAQHEYVMAENSGDEEKADVAYFKVLDCQENLSIEISDVYISLRALMHYYNLDDDIMDRVVEKLNRKY